MPPVHLIDYGIGNIFNIVRALRHIGIEVILCQTPKLLREADCVLLPGVGAFGNCMEALKQRGFIEPIKQYVQNNGFLLGICVGMQLLADKSEEFGVHQGLGLIPGTVKHLKDVIPNKNKITVPHIAWREVVVTDQAQLLLNSSYYFVHSYVFCCDNPENEIAHCLYENVQVVAIVGKGNVYGVQFHPEKSGENGLRLLKFFIQQSR